MTDIDDMKLAQRLYFFLYLILVLFSYFCKLNGDLPCVLPQINECYSCKYKMKMKAHQTLTHFLCR